MSDPSQVPEWPRIHARIAADGSGEVDLNGNLHRLAGEETLEGARRHLENHLAGIATWLSRPVRAFAEAPDGCWSLVVHPDGTVEREAPVELPQGLIFPLPPAAAEEPPAEESPAEEPPAEEPVAEEPVEQSDEAPVEDVDLLRRIRQLAPEATGDTADPAGARGRRRKPVVIVAVAMLVIGGAAAGYRVATTDGDPAATAPGQAHAAVESPEAAVPTPTSAVEVDSAAPAPAPVAVRAVRAGEGWVALRLGATRRADLRITVTELGPRGRPLLRRAVVRRLHLEAGDRRQLRVEGLAAGTYRWRLEVLSERDHRRRSGRVEVVAAPEPQAPASPTEAPDPSVSTTPAPDDAPPPTSDDPPPDDGSSEPAGGGLDDGLA